MNPIITSTVGLIATLTGACAMLLMLELRGAPDKDSKTSQRLLKAHRITGYIFIALFFVILAIMFAKVGAYQEKFSPRTILHIALGLLLIPLLTIKILIIRRFKRLGTQVPGLGLTVFLALFLLNSMTAGYYFLHQSDPPPALLSKEGPQQTPGQHLVSVKCVQCHTLERVFKSFKSEQVWTDTVQRMAVMNAPNISDLEAEQIIHYLISQQRRREKLTAAAQDAQESKENMGKTSVSKKCVVCHTLEQVYKAKKNRSEWTGTVERMMRYSDRMDFLNQKEKEIVIEFLSNRVAAQPDSER